MSNTPRTLARDFSRGEVTYAFVWLAVFAASTALIEAAYLDTRLTTPLGDFAFPWPIPFALAFNAVLTKTARLWTLSRAAQLIPLVIWVVGVWLWGGLVASASIVPLILAGVAGGVWPVTRKR